MQKTIDTKKLVRIITIVALLVVLPLALLLIRQRQEIRKKAGATPHISFPAGPYSVNDVITVTIGNFPAGLLFAEVTSFSFDNTKWQVVQSPYDVVSGPTAFVSPSAANNYKLRVGAGSYGAPFSGAVLYKMKLKPLVAAAADDPLRLTLVYNLVDATAIETAGSEEATVVVSQLSSTPTTAPATPTVPGAPVNSISAPSIAAVAAGANPYSVQVSLSASPAPSLFGGAVNVIKVLGTPTSAQPPASAWSGACSGALPTGGVIYCSPTMSSSLNYVFNGATPGTKYLWAIFHNDVGNTAAAYWGTSNGWSNPVSTGAITLPGPSATPSTTMPTASPTPCVDATAPSTPPISSANCDDANCYYSWETSTDSGGTCPAIGGVEYLYKAFDSSAPSASASPCGASQGGGCWRTGNTVTLPMTTIANVSNILTACPSNTCTLRVWAKDANGNISGTQTRTFPIPASCANLDTTRPPAPSIASTSCTTTTCAFSWSPVNDAGCAGGIKYLYKIFSSSTPTGTETDCTAPGGSCWRTTISDSLDRSIIIGSPSYLTACPSDTCTLSLWAKDANGNISSIATRSFSTLPRPTNTPVP